MKTLSLAGALLLVVMATASISQAGESESSDSLFTPVSIRATGGAIADSDFKSSGGSAQVSSGEVRVKAGSFSLGYEGKKYSWSDVNRLNFGNGKDNPWDTLHRVRLGYEHEGEINRDWYYSAEVAATSSFEKEMSGSLGAAVRGGFMYVINDNWATEFGAQIFTNNIETTLLPYIGIGYENFDADGAGLFMNLGAPSTEAGYSFSDEATVRFTFGMDGKTYRLKDDSSVVKKGYMSTSSMKTGLYFDWNPTDALSLTLGPEYHFEREMRLYKQDGKRTGPTIKQEAAYGGILQVKYTF